MKIVLNEFKGIMPKLANDKLPINMAQTASDVKTSTGELRAYNKPTSDTALTGTSYKTLFEYNDGSNDSWVYHDAVVHWVRSPVADDTFKRMYLTGLPAIKAQGTITFTDGMTDGETLTIGAEVFEFDVPPDGVGGGNTVVDVSSGQTKEESAAALAALTPSAAVTFTDNLDGTVTVEATTAGVAGNTIAFSEVGAHITLDTFQGTTYLGGTQQGFDGDVYSAYVNDKISGSFDFEKDLYHPGAPAAAANGLAYTSGGTDYRAYFYTYVSRYGEEGPPSAICETVDANGTADWDGSSNLVLSTFVEPDDDDEHLKRVVGSNAPAIRIYRTSTDGTGNSGFLLVEEVAVDNTGPNSTAWAAYTYTDSDDAGIDGNLGAECSSALYDRAPDDLTNLRGHPNGFFVASKDNVLHFSEPFAPWAWPTDYKIPIDQTIVSIGVFGSTIVVATDGNVYTFSGPHPTSLYKTRLDYQPCLSQQGLVETTDGVIFPSYEGFIKVSAQAVTNVTKDTFSPSDWADYELETVKGVWWNKAYYGFYSSADYEGHFIIDFLNGAITTGIDVHECAYVRLADGTLRTITNTDVTDPGTYYISQWDNDPERYNNYTYKSPRFILEKPGNFKVAQVILDDDFLADVEALIAASGTLTAANQTAWDDTDWANDIEGAINGVSENTQEVNGDTLLSLLSLGVQSTVQFNVYVNSVLKFSKAISDSQMFKLPGGFKHKKWEVELIGMIPVKRVTLATSSEEIV